MDELQELTLSVAATFASTLRELSTLPDEALSVPDQLARACVAALPVDGAGMSYALTPGRRWPVGASGDRSAEAERLQFATGEGPCTTAQGRRETVIAPLLALRDRWPVFSERLTTLTAFQTVIAFPVAGPLAGVVVVDLYCRHPEIVSPEAVGEIPIVADLVGAALAADLSGSGGALGIPDTLVVPSVVGRQRVWLAAGHIGKELAISNSSSLALLRAYAFRDDIDLETVADRIFAGDVTSSAFDAS